MATKLFETLIKSLGVFDFEYILVQSCSVVVDLMFILIHEPDSSSSPKDYVGGSNYSSFKSKRYLL